MPSRIILIFENFILSILEQLKKNYCFSIPNIIDLSISVEPTIVHYQVKIKILDRVIENVNKI